MVAPLQLQAARYRMRLTNGRELVDASFAAMTESLESEPLIRLASENDPIMAHAGPQFEKALRELAIAIPDRSDACWTILRHHIEEIADGTKGPRDGVQAILDDLYHPGDLHEQTTENVGDSHGIHDLLGCFYGLDDIEERPSEVSCDGKYGADAIAAVEAHIRELAVGWLVDHPSEGR